MAHLNTMAESKYQSKYSNEIELRDMDKNPANTVDLYPERQPLINKGYKSCPCWSRHSDGNRLIHLNGRRLPKSCPSNGVTNTKYNVFTFIPLILFN